MHVADGSQIDETGYSLDTVDMAGLTQSEILARKTLPGLQRGALADPTVVVHAGEQAVWCLCLYQSVVLWVILVQLNLWNYNLRREANMEEKWSKSQVVSIARFRSMQNALNGTEIACP